jgi:hypothetical protein
VIGSLIRDVVWQPVVKVRCAIVLTVPSGPTITGSADWPYLCEPNSPDVQT